jgi:hypothetical protein
VNSIRIRRHELTLLPESARVIIRPFIPAESRRVASIIGRVLALSEKEVGVQLGRMRGEFDGRHLDIESSLLAHFEKVRKHVISQRTLSRERQLLIGAMFSGEYALESAAIFNPSIVPHPDQSEAPDGGLRFIMSLRATGEGHISSIEFRAGTLAPSLKMGASRSIRSPGSSLRRKSFLIPAMRRNVFRSSCAKWRSTISTSMKSWGCSGSGSRAAI